jgi:hypothetical protein
VEEEIHGMIDEFKHELENRGIIWWVRILPLRRIANRAACEHCHWRGSRKILLDFDRRGS